MFARIARFEGGSPEIIGREVDRLRRDIDAAKSGAPVDPSVTALSNVVDRVLMLVDRNGGASTMIVFCDTEDKLVEADRILDSMSPETGQGKRVSRELCEVAVDTPLGTARRAA